MKNNRKVVKKRKFLKKIIFINLEEYLIIFYEIFVFAIIYNISDILFESKKSIYNTYEYYYKR